MTTGTGQSRRTGSVTRPGGRHTRLRQVLPLVAWLTTLVVAIVLFTALGSGRLAAPPVADPGGWGQWVADRDPVVATGAVLRLVVLALAWYLVGVTTVGALGRLARIASLVRVADTLSIPPVRRVLQASLGVGLATAVVAASPPGAAIRPATPTTSVAAPAADADATTAEVRGGLPPPGMRPVAPADTGRAAGPDDTAHPTMQPLAGSDTDAGPPGMRPLAPTSDDPPAVDAVRPPDRLAPPIPVDAPTDHGARDGDGDEGAAVAHDTWTVASGDHLWAIAEAHLRTRLDAGPSDEVVADYWRRLIEANRGRLVDPDDPDLVVPGQVFALPDVEDDG